MQHTRTQKLLIGIWILIFLLAVCLFFRCLSAFGAKAAADTDSVKARPATLSDSGSFSLSFQNAIVMQAVRTVLPGLFYTASAPDNQSSFSIAKLCVAQWEPLAVYADKQSSASYTAESVLSQAVLSSAAGSDTESDGSASGVGNNSDSGAADSNDPASGTDTDSDSDAADGNDPASSTANGSNPGTANSNAPTDSTDGGNSSTANGSDPASGTDNTTNNSGDAAAPAHAVQTTAGVILQHGAAASLPYSAAQLTDFNYLLNHLYTLDSTTTIDAALLDGNILMTKDMTLAKDSNVPQILIYHTHSQEEFVDSTPGNPATSIVGIGDYLTLLLRDVYGYNVIHDTQTYDLIDGDLDRNKAYTLALHSVSDILEANPSIQVVIDLHRDGINGDKMTTVIDGRETATLMFFNGLSRTVKNGALDSLYNPYIQDNLAFSLQLKLMAERYYPGSTRPVYLKGYRYNLHLRPRCLLVECGSQKNTVQEEKYAMEVLADVLDMVLRGEQ